jgi:hypothetical protein
MQQQESDWVMLTEPTQPAHPQSLAAKTKIYVLIQEYLGLWTLTAIKMHLAFPEVFASTKRETRLIESDDPDNDDDKLQPKKDNIDYIVLYDSIENRLLEFPRLDLDISEGNSTSVEQVFFVTFQSQRSMEMACTGITCYGHLFGDPDTNNRVKITRLRLKPRNNLIISSDQNLQGIYHLCYHDSQFTTTFYFPFGNDRRRIV